MSISIVLHSGLGNRLFQWAGLAQQAHLTGRQVILYDDLVGPNVHDDSLHSYFCNLVRPLRKKKLSGTVEQCSGIPDEALVKQSKAATVVLLGYFFDAKQAPFLRPYVMPQLEDLLQRKTFRWTHSMVHVRLNDYRGGLNLQNAQSTPMQVYYKRAWALCKEDPSMVYEVYSDEPSKALEWLPNDMRSTCRVMDKTPLQDTFESMMTCNGGISANSTFSWWAFQFQQWLTVDLIAKYQQTSSWTLQRKKPVYMPDPWARLQDLARWTSPISRSHPITESIQPDFVTRVKQPSHNWTFVEVHLLVGLFLAVVCLALFGLKTIHMVS